MACKNCDYGRRTSCQRGGGINMGYFPRKRVTGTKLNRHAHGIIPKRGSKDLDICGPIYYVTRVHCINKTDGVEWHDMDEYCDKDTSDQHFLGSLE